MAKREEPIRARHPRRSPSAQGSRAPQAPTRDERSRGAAVQLAAVHRTLRHGPVLQLQAGGAAARVQRAGAPSATAPNRTGLPDRLKSGVEALSGLSLDDVRVHRNSARPAALQAHAYTQGSDIHVAPGQEQHLPHEAWHVVQQKQGRVKPTLQMKGVAINDQPELEAEADAMAARALRTSAPAAPLERGAQPAPVAQLYWFRDDDGKTDWIDGYCGPPLIKSEVIHGAALGHPAGNVWILPAQQPMEEPAKEEPAPYKYVEPAEYAEKRGEHAKPSSKQQQQSSPKEKAVELTLAEKEKAEQIKEYLALIPHLAGEGGGKSPLKGGHLLEEMKTKYKNNLRLSGETDQAKPWEGWWSDNAAPAKWSSFFPAPWTNNTLVTALWKSSTVKGGRELPGGITITKQGDTFFPWVNQTLKEQPKLKDMKAVK
jgi:Domain of unknown function (DUF4157)